MSIDFKAVLFFAMPIDGDKGSDLVEIFEELNGPLEITNTDFYTEDGRYMLHVRDSWNSGDKHEEAQLIKLSDVTGKEQAWRQLIADACTAHGITFVEPDWYFATMFS